MAVSKGKPFEKKVETQLCALDNLLVERLHDQMSGYVKVSQNPSDYILYRFPSMIYLECKSHRGASISMKDLPQLERLEQRCINRKGVYGIFIIWFIDHKCTFWVDWKYVKEKEKCGLKSLNYQQLRFDCNHTDLVKEVPANYPRVYGVYDFEEILKYYA